MHIVGVGNRWLILVIAFACGGSAGRPQAPAARPTVTVLDPGAEPRVRLRYEPKLHHPERLEMTTKLRATTAFTNTVLEEGRRSVDFPTARIAGHFEVTAINPDGDAVVAYVVDEADVLDDVVDPAVRARYQREVVTMKGLRGSWRMSSSGIRSDFAVEATAGARSRSEQSASFNESMRNAWVVFPDAPIGIGATWKSTSQESVDRAEWDRTVTYTLRHLDGATATIDAEVVGRAPAQALRVEPRATTKLTSGTSTSIVQMIVPLHGLVPTVTSRRSAEVSFLIVRRRLRISSTIQSELFFSVRPSAAIESQPPPADEPPPTNIDAR